MSLPECIRALSYLAKERSVDVRVEGLDKLDLKSKYHLQAILIMVYMNASTGTDVVIYFESAEVVTIICETNDRNTERLMSHLTDDHNIVSEYDPPKLSITMVLSPPRVNLDPIPSKKTIKPLHSEIRKNLTSYFKSIQQLEQAAFGRGKSHGEFLRQVNQIIINHIDKERFSSKDLCSHLYISAPQLNRRIKRLTQMTPGKYIMYVKLDRAKRLLEENPLMTISEVIIHVGIKSNSYFSKSFNQQFGYNPSSLRRDMIKKSKKTIQLS